jgi:hypothetical protein
VSVSDRLRGFCGQTINSCGAAAPSKRITIRLPGGSCGDRPQVPLTIDEQVVEVLAPQCAYEPFGVGVRTRRSRRCLDDPYAAAGELAGFWMAFGAGYAGTR